MDLKKILELWENHVRLEVKETTWGQYTMIERTHIFPFLHSCNKITITEIDEFVLQKVETGLGNKYIQDILIVLQSILKYMVSLGVLDVVPELPNLRVEINPDIRFFSRKEQETLLYELNKNKSDYIKIAVPLALYMGLRVGEICGLQDDDFDKQAHTITIKRTVQRIRDFKNSKKKTKVAIITPKTPNSRRTIVVPDCAFPICCRNNGFLIGGNRLIEPRLLQKQFTTLMKKCNIQDATFHTLRHTFACNCIQSGMDIKTLSYILGHKNTAFTLKRYVHTNLETQRNYFNVPLPMV